MQQNTTNLHKTRPSFCKLATSWEIISRNLSLIKIIPSTCHMWMSIILIQKTRKWNRGHIQRDSAILLHPFEECSIINYAILLLSLSPVIFNVNQQNEYAFTLFTMSTFLMYVFCLVGLWPNTTASQIRTWPLTLQTPSVVGILTKLDWYLTLSGLIFRQQQCCW